MTNKLLTKIFVSVLVLCMAGWIAWVSTGLVQAKIDNFRLCEMAKSIEIIKGDVKELKEFFLGHDEQKRP